MGRKKSQAQLFHIFMEIIFSHCFVKTDRKVSQLLVFCHLKYGFAVLQGIMAFG